MILGAGSKQPKVASLAAVKKENPTKLAPKEARDGAGFWSQAFAALVSSQYLHIV